MVIVGAGGHARSLIAVMQDEGIEVKAVYDESFQDSRYHQDVWGVPIMGPISGVPPRSIVLSALGDNRNRVESIRFLLGECKCEIGTYLSTRATIAGWNVTIDQGSCVLPHAYLGPSVHVGTGCIVNTGAILEHDVRVGEFSHVSIRATVAGSVSIGSRCFVGASATLIDKISICDDVIIGAGAVAISDIREPGTYVGVPARKVQAPKSMRS